MDNKTAHTLVKLNNAFYTQVHDSFSQTRQAPWNGWKRLVEEIPSSFWNRSSLNVLDLACGNGRFEQFLTSLHSHTVFKALCVDSCDELFAREVLSPSASLATTFYHWDILDELHRAPCDLPLADLSVCFGFFHHIPRKDWREHVLAYLIAQTAPNGYIALSFWSFLNDERFAHKARQAHAHAIQWLNEHPTALDNPIDTSQLQANDFFLGWQHSDGIYRYCHSYTTEEIDELLAALPPSVSVVSRYYADGKHDNLNEYVILHCKDTQKHINPVV